MVFTVLVVLALVFGVLSVVPAIPAPVPWVGVAVILLAVALLVGGGLRLS